MKTHIVTHYQTDIWAAQKFWNMSRENNRKWAAKLGWNFILDEKERTHDIKLKRGIYRIKALVIYDALLGMDLGDRALWLDGDTLIVRDPSAIFGELGDAKVGMAKFRPKTLNSGVMPIVVCEETLDLFKTALNYNGNRDGYCCESAIMWAANNMEREPTGIIREIDRKWNENWNTRDGDTRIFGFHMMAPTRSAALMEKAMNYSLRDLGCKFNDKP